jgi:tetratricopeptide (TPR) repeat protein
VAAEPAPSPTAGAEVAADESAPQTAPLPSETVEEAGQDTAAAVAAVPSDVEDQGASGPADALTADLAAGAAAGVEPAGQTAEAAVPGADETPAVTPEPAEPATDLTAGPEAADAGTAGAAAPVAVEAPAAEAAPDTAADTGQARAEPAATTTPYRVLAAAREAYWLRDYAAAEQKYQELIALDPDNPDGYGELGNMYFSQGDWEKASAAYYEAGTRLATEGLYDRARQLVEVIRGLNGGQADDLEQQIEVAESAAP